MFFYEATEKFSLAKPDSSGQFISLLAIWGKVNTSGKLFFRLKDF
jgi:hypothetical protein